MSLGDIVTPRSRGMDFLKSIVDEGGGDLQDINDDRTPRLSLLPPKPQHTDNMTPRSTEDIIKVNVNIKERLHSESDLEVFSPKSQREGSSVQNSDTDEQGSWRRSGRRKPPQPQRPFSGHKPPSNKLKLENRDAARLEQKYLELRSLLLDNNNGQANLNRSLVAEVTATAQRYHLAARGLVPGSQLATARRHRLPNLLEDEFGGRRTRVRPQSGRTSAYRSAADLEPGSYILIDGTGSEVKTRTVTFAPNEAESVYSSPYGDSDIIHMEKEISLRNRQNSPGRGRTRYKPGRKKNAWGSKGHSKINSKPSSQKSTPRMKSPRACQSRSSSRSLSGDRKQKETSAYLSDSFTSDSSSNSSRSRSRSRSKGRTAELHLKYSHNPKLLEWLKEKDKKFKEMKREERKLKRKKRKAEKLKEKEKEKLKEKSDKAVEKWMKEKRRCARLLRRGQNADQSLVRGGGEVSGEDLIVVDEVLDLKEHGVRVDPNTIPNVSKPASPRPELLDKQPGSNRRGRPQSAVNLAYSRPTTGRHGRFVESAKAKARKEQLAKQQEQEEAKKKRIKYDDWLKSKRQQEKAMKDKANDHSDTVDAPKSEESSPHEKAEDPDNVTRDNKPEVKKQRPKSCKRRTRKQGTHDGQEELTPTPPSYPKKETSPRNGDNNNADKSSPEQDNAPITPRPEFGEREAYKAIKHEQKSWDKFADYVWSETLKSEEEEGKGDKEIERPEPQGSDSPDKSLGTESQENPAPETSTEGPAGARPPGDRDSPPPETSTEGPAGARPPGHRDSPPPEQWSAVSPDPAPGSPINMEQKDERIQSKPATPTPVEDGVSRTEPPQGVVTDYIYPPHKDDEFLSESTGDQGNKDSTDPGKSPPPTGDREQDAEPTKTHLENPVKPSQDGGGPDLMDAIPSGAFLTSSD